MLAYRDMVRERLREQTHICRIRAIPLGPKQAGNEEQLLMGQQMGHKKVFIEGSCRVGFSGRLIAPAPRLARWAAATPGRSSFRLGVERARAPGRRRRHLGEIVDAFDSYPSACLRKALFVQKYWAS